MYNTWHIFILKHDVQYIIANKIIKSTTHIKWFNLGISNEPINDFNVDIKSNWVNKGYLSVRDMNGYKQEWTQKQN